MTRQAAELQDAVTARAFLLQSLWLQRIGAPNPGTIRESIELAGLIVGEGHPLLPLGVLADLVKILTEPGGLISRHATIPGLPPSLLRGYEDQFLSRLSADPRLDRAGIALRRYGPADRLRGLAFTIRQLISNWKLRGVELSPAWLRSLLTEDAGVLLKEGWDSLEAGPRPEWMEALEDMIRVARRSVDTLAPEDVIAIEQRMALADYSQFVAHRQLLQQAARFESALPVHPPKHRLSPRETPTRILDEDQYPVGGYASIGTRGSLESLLHSQLAFMEDDERPDLFDVKFVRDELFYYTRDENQFLRRRRAFAIHFAGDMIEARVKDAEQPAQRIVLAGALVLALIRRLSDWLSRDALHFEVSFDPALESEAEIFRILLIEDIRRGVVTVAVHEYDAPSSASSNLLITTKSSSNDALVIQDLPRLVLDGETYCLDGEAWTSALRLLIRAWN